jgi:hypothetical protein
LTHPYALSDNKLLYGLLVDLTMGTPGYTYVKKFKTSFDGRSAYLALQEQGEGPAAKALRKQEARNTIKAAVYTGKGSFTHQAYSDIHARAHEELEHLGEPVPGSQMVTDYLAGIKCPDLETNKTIAEADPSMMEDFKKCQQYIQAAVNKKKLNKLAARGIASVNGQGNSGKRKGNGGGRGGQSKGTSKKQKRYNSQEWKALTQAQRDKILADRKARKAASATKKQEAGSKDDKASSIGMVQALRALVQEQGSPDGAGNKSITIKVSGVATTPADDKPAPKQADGIKKNAGSQFGRNAHSKATATKKTTFATPTTTVELDADE